MERDTGSSGLWFGNSFGPVRVASPSSVDKVLAVELDLAAECNAKRWMQIKIRTPNKRTSVQRIKEKEIAHTKDQVR